VRSELDLAGENSAMRCDDMMVAVSNAMFLCLREKLKCQESALADGTPVVACTGGANNECDRQATFAADDFWATPSNRTCKEMKGDVTKAGCGNLITEFGEDCDLGEGNGTPNAACSEKCKTIVAQADGPGAAPVAAPVAAPAAAPAAVPPPAENGAASAASGSCALHFFGNNDFLLWQILVLGAGIVLLWKTRRSIRGL